MSHIESEAGLQVYGDGSVQIIEIADTVAHCGTDMLAFFGGTPQCIFPSSGHGRAREVLAVFITEVI